MKTHISIGIVAHHERMEYANKLAETVGAEVMSVDDVGRSAEWNHRRVLEWMADGDNEWSVILEDDAVPTQGFIHQLNKALPWAPTPFVGLYVGRGRPPHWQAGISAVLAHDVCWLTCSTLMSAVGYAVKTKLTRSIITSLDKTWAENPSLPIDQAITVWGQEDMKMEFCYPKPSLVNHLDIPPVQKHDYGVPTEPRKAWTFGGRDTWDDSSIPLQYVPSW